MITLPFQEIFEEVERVLPKEWTKFVMYIEYTGSAYLMKFFVKTHEDEVVDCYDLKGVSKKELRIVFSNIDEIIYPIRKQSKVKDRWTVATLTVEATGEMHCDFEYSDADEDMIKYYEEWYQSNNP